MVRNITRGRWFLLAAGAVVTASLIVALLFLLRPPTLNDSPQGTNQEQGAQNVIGTWRSKETDRPYLTLKEDHTLVGHDGCNGLSGRFTFSDDGEKIFIHDLFGTLKACPGVDTWLRKARSAIIDGDTLTLFDDADEVIGTLERD